MIRGEVYWTNFPQGVGGEVRGSRPAVIVSNDSATNHLNRVQVIPLTSNVGRLFEGEAIVSFRGRRSKALATQIMTLDKSRIGRRMGGLSSSDLGRIDAAIREQLAL